MKLLNTGVYLLLIQEEAEIKEGDTVYRDTGIIFKITNECISYYKEIIPKTVHKIYRCIAYYPLTEEAKELDLPLLPNPFKDEFNNINELAIKHWESRTYEDMDMCCDNFIAGYKAAQSKQFSLEDIKEAFRAGRKHGEDNACSAEINLSPSEEDYIQSLSTQQLPKEFIPEYQRVRDWDNRDINGDYNSKLQLKTITNSEGKEVVQGEWIY